MQNMTNAYMTKPGAQLTMYKLSVGHFLDCSYMDGISNVMMQQNAG